MVNRINTKVAYLLALFYPIHAQHLLGVSYKRPGSENMIFCTPNPTLASKSRGRKR